MKVEVRGEPTTNLEAYAAIPISFEVAAVFDVEASTNGFGFVLIERRLDAPYVKDYGADGEDPAKWMERYDTSNWQLITARVNGRASVGPPLPLILPAWRW